MLRPANRFGVPDLAVDGGSVLREPRPCNPPPVVSSTRRKDLHEGGGTLENKLVGQRSTSSQIAAHAIISISVTTTALDTDFHPMKIAPTGVYSRTGAWAMENLEKKKSGHVHPCLSEWNSRGPRTATSALEVPSTSVKTWQSRAGFDGIDACACCSVP